MIKRFLKNVSQSFCIYILAALNLFHAIEHQNYDWLLLVSTVLVVLSLAMNLASAYKEGNPDDQA